MEIINDFAFLNKMLQFAIIVSNRVTGNEEYINKMLTKVLECLYIQGYNYISKRILQRRKLQSLFGIDLVVRLMTKYVDNFSGYTVHQTCVPIIRRIQSPPHRCPLPLLFFLVSQARWSKRVYTFKKFLQIKNN